MSANQVDKSDKKPKVKPFKKIQVEGTLIFERGFWLIKSRRGRFHVLTGHLPSDPCPGQKISQLCEVIPGYGIWKGRSVDC